MLARQLDQWLAILRTHTGGVNDCQTSRGQPLARNEVQHFERRSRRRLIVLVVGDQATTIIGRNNLGRQEMTPGKGGLPRPGGTYQNDERQLRKSDFHGPTSARLDQAEESQLGWRSRFRMNISYGEILDLISEALALMAAPGLKLLACPFEAVIAVAECACGKSLEMHVVLPVRRGHNDKSGSRG